MKVIWYVVPASEHGRKAEEEEELDLEARLLVLPPSAPRLPRRVRGKKKSED